MRQLMTIGFILMTCIFFHVSWCSSQLIDKSWHNNFVDIMVWAIGVYHIGQPNSGRIPETGNAAIIAEICLTVRVDLYTYFFDNLSKAPCVSALMKYPMPGASCTFTGRRPAARCPAGDPRCELGAASCRAVGIYRTEHIRVQVPFRDHSVLRGDRCWNHLALEQNMEIFLIQEEWKRMRKWS
jgi:hypothetical protein